MMIMFRTISRNDEPPYDPDEMLIERCCYGNAWTEPCPFVQDPEECLLYETGREMDLCVRVKRIAKEEAIEDELAAEEMAREYEDDVYYCGCIGYS